MGTGAQRKQNGNTSLTFPIHNPTDLSQTQHIKKGMLTFNWQRKSSTLSPRKSISCLFHQTPVSSSLFFSLHSELNITCFTSEESSGFTDDCFKTVICHMCSLKQLH